MAFLSRWQDSSDPADGTCVGILSEEDHDALPSNIRHASSPTTFRSSLRVMLPYLARNPKTTLKFLSLYVREHDFWSSDAVFTIREYTNTADEYQVAGILSLIESLVDGRANPLKREFEINLVPLILPAYKRSSHQNRRRMAEILCSWFAKGPHGRGLFGKEALQELHRHVLRVCAEESARLIANLSTKARARDIGGPVTEFRSSHGKRKAESGSLEQYGPPKTRPRDE